ncbi:hypothetical protein L873DRAFT_1785328 [Choiromyces venosus 120613-1]|uniref:Uncharacterized protein n=1 Tax=Choiromyces venosus 120613-1 TaxID=1336337 RepID=A0A3N4K8I8_9PEZI|nr:hypothetical protein L873DRAFT_1785328 [Choiromyces venosus 120613-1]
MSASIIFSEWILKNQTLIGGFSGVGIIIADGRYDRRDIKKELEAFRISVDGQLTKVQAELQAEHEFTQGLILRSAIKTMKALDGNKKDMREFIKEMDKVIKCIEAGEDCQKGDKN